jgi:hypothetical protein
MPSTSEVPLVPPDKEPPSPDWLHYKMWQRVNDLLYALPNYFDTELVIKGINVTEIFSIGGAFSTVVDAQVVDILNRLRNIWDPDNLYSEYTFVRQSQTFPDVLLRHAESENDILFGIELKSWYILSKEGEPSFRYKVTPSACASADLLVIIPWILSEVISGKPRLLTPYKELARYAAKYRNFYWQRSRLDSDRDPNIISPIAVRISPYPDSKQEASDKANDDKGSNFGRIARAGILDDYVNKLVQQDYLGIKITHWIEFLKAISENRTDIEIKNRIERLRNKIISEAENQERDGEVELQLATLGILDQLERIWSLTGG